MLSVVKTFVYQTNRFFDKLPMTCFCKSQNISKLIVGPHSGTRSHLFNFPRVFDPGLFKFAPSGDLPHLSYSIIPQNLIGVDTQNDIKFGLFGQPLKI